MANLSRPSFYDGAVPSAVDAGHRVDVAAWLEWPPIPEGMQGVEIVAIARVVERVCGASAAARYLMEAAAAFGPKKNRPRVRPWTPARLPMEAHAAG